MSLQEKEKILAQLEDTGTGKGQLLSQWQVPRTTYYRWRSQQRQGKLGRSTQNPRIPWNSLS
jgi:transposase-like protein